MTFKRLSEFFAKLESTASRNSMVEILAKLFKEAGDDEIGQIVYLTQGRVAPLYEPVEFGMAEKMVLKALAQAYGVSLESVTAAFKKSGDLGEVAENLSRLGNLSHLRNLSVTEVFTKLQDITKSSGEGSVEKKIAILAKLLTGSDPVSARYIARIPVDKLRLGFSDMTVLEALSWMIDGTKKHKPIIEAAYNIRPDLGEIAKLVKEGLGKKEGLGGLDKLRNITPKVGTPILVMRAERLTNTADILEKCGNQAAVEPKLDGLRTQLHLKRSHLSNKGETFIQLYSRGLENVTVMYPDLVEAAKQELGARGKGPAFAEATAGKLGVSIESVILDGEAIGFDPKTGKFLPFQETVQRKRKYDITEKTKSVPIQLVVFDCLFLNGKSLMEEPYEVRRKKLLEVLGEVGNVRDLGGRVIVPVQVEIVDGVKEMEKFFQECVKKGLEGMMAKKLDGTYQAGARGYNWIKLKGSYTGKMNDTVDAVVMGIDFGQGKRNSFGVGAFLIGVYDQKSDSFKTVSKVGTGLTDGEWRDLKAQSAKLKTEEKPVNYDVNKLNDCDVWVKPKLVGEFRADELTKSPMHTSGYALRFPRLVRWREKKPEDTTSVKEIEEMVKLQKK